MKYYKRLLSVFVVCALLFVPFSTVVHAEGDSLSNVRFRYSMANPNFQYMFFSESVGAHELENSSGTHRRDLTQRGATYYHLFEFSGADNFTNGSNYIFKKGESITLNFKKIQLSMDYNSHYLFHLNSFVDMPSSFRVEIFDNLGNSKNFYFWANDESAIQLKYDSIRFDLLGLRVEDLPFDVYKFRIVMPFTYSQYYDTEGCNFLTYFTDRINTVGTSTNTIFNFSISEFSADVESVDTGLFKSIVAWLTKIRDGITGLGTKLSNVFNSLEALPGVLWDKISEGLKTLFIPDANYFNQYSERWDSLLSARFGAIYQVGAKIGELGQSILNSAKGETMDYITVPVANIPIGNGYTFAFGGWQIPIKVQGLEIIYTTCKTLVTIGATFLFLNGLRKRYDEVMGVEQ